MRMPKVLYILCAVAVAAVGCQNKDDDDTVKIGMMPKLIGIDFFNACERGAKEAAKELGVELVYDGPPVNSDTKQIEMLDTWITRKMDVIAIAPNNPDSVAPTLKRARKKGIKVLSWDADAKADSRDYYISQATYEAVGYALVDTLAAQIDGKGEVAIVTGSLTAANQNIWIDHMKARMKDKYPDMKLVTTEASEENQQLAFKKTKGLIKAYPNLKGIFAITSVALPGAAQAIREAGQSGKLALTGLSTPNCMKPYVKDGTVEAFVLWSPVDLGYLTIYAAKILHEKGSLPSEFEAGRLGKITVTDSVVLLGDPIVFTKDNIDKYDF